MTEYKLMKMLLCSNFFCFNGAAIVKLSGEINEASHELKSGSFSLKEINSCKSCLTSCLKEDVD